MAPRAPEPAPTDDGPKEEPVGVAPTFPDDPPSNDDPAREFQRALLALLPKEGAVDAEKVREIVRGELSAIPPREFVVKNPGREPIKIDGPLPEWYETVLRKVSADIPTLLIGPAGCGKTYIAEKVAKALGLRFGFLSLSAGVSESALTGWLVPGDGGKFEYLPALFVDFYENGGLFLIDELDAADPNVLLVINAAVANGHLAIPHRAGNPIVERHPDFRIIAAANTYGTGATREYQGRNALDAATLDRFKIGRVACDYDPQVEEGIIEASVLAWGRKVREEIAQHGLRRTVTTRNLVDATKALAAGDTIEGIAESFFLDWTADEKAKVGA